MEIGSVSPAIDPVSAPARKDRERVRVMLVISSLEHGGAEGHVLALAEHLDPARFETHHTVEATGDAYEALLTEISPTARTRGSDRTCAGASRQCL